jgi:hypothetical protein
MMATPPISNDHTIKVLQSELEYRRSKQGSIFTWSSAILVAIAGSPLVLGTTLQRLQKIFVSIAVIILALMVFLWLTYNADRESRTAERLEELAACDLGHKSRRELNRRSTLSPFVGYRMALILLAVAALVAIWCWT